jgi:hypothetical protein
MKKFVVLLAVVAMTCFSAMAFAADVTIGGSIEVRSRDFNNLKALPSGYDSMTGSDYRDTQERIRIDVNAKAGDVKGKLELEQDFNVGANDWGTGNDIIYNKAGGSAYSNSTLNGNLGFREAWINFNVPGIPLNVTAGHQLLALGNGWFFKNMHYGDDAWVVANVTGGNTFAVADIKVLEGNISAEDDIDAYAALDVIKLGENATFGVDIANVRDRRGVGASLWGIPGAEHSNLYNLGLNFNATLGALKLKIQGDQQFGHVAGVYNNPDFKGNELVIQGNVGLDALTINFTAARGSGQKSDSDNVTAFINYLDIDPHYTFLYEYKVATAMNGMKYTGFANTTALSAGVAIAAAKSLTIGLDYWYLRATEATAIGSATDIYGNDVLSREIGQELDLKINWQLYDNLSWNWVLGYFMPGSAYDSHVSGAPNGTNTSSDDITGIQGVLAFKF